MPSVHSTVTNMYVFMCNSVFCDCFAFCIVLLCLYMREARLQHQAALAQPQPPFFLSVCVQLCLLYWLTRSLATFAPRPPQPTSLLPTPSSPFRVVHLGPFFRPSVLKCVGPSKPESPSALCIAWYALGRPIPYPFFLEPISAS